MRTVRRSLLVRMSTLLLIAFVLAACASSGASGPAGVGDGSPPQADLGGPVAQPGTADGSTAGENGGTGKPGDGVGAPVDDARIVRTGSMDLEVTDVDAAVATARDGIRALGGYIGASNTSSQGDEPIATITYRIPVDRWEDALALLRVLGGQTTKVVDEQTQAVEVTGSIVDLEARIRNLRASEIALQGIAERTTKVSDVLEVQAQLTAVRGEIESLTAQLADLADRADLATLTATFRVPVVAVTATAKGWDPATVVDEATASLLDLGQGLATVGIRFAIVWLPVIVAITIIALAILWVARRTGLGRRGHQDPGGVAPSGA